MDAKRLIAAHVTPGQVRIDIVQVFDQEDRAAALALAEKTGVEPVDLSHPEFGEVLLFEVGTTRDEIDAAVREAWARLRRATH